MAWHHCIPSLLDEEAKIVDNEFKSEVVKFFESFDTPPQVLGVKNLPILSQRIHFLVQEHLKKCNR